MNAVFGKKFFLLLFGVLLAGWVVAQDYQRQYGGRRVMDEDLRNGVPMWEESKEFKDDVFTFARIQYDSHYGNYGWRGGRGGGWGGGWGGG